MKRHARISPAEWEVMRIIWAGSPILAREVIAGLGRSRNWHAKTIRTLLARLVKKRVLHFQKQGRAYLYRPLVPQADCVQAECQSFLDRVFDGALVPLFTQFLEGREISDSQRRELRLLLEAKKKPRKRN
ncbi:MAG TPA: BlaI/MecI/CopY family transcriptional regulator [Candidatus Acidoferrum sp.]|nr:BlaI/MecI/CopY family transcriptional regulator [Candidatus Acidoferrum sp.]